MVVWCESPRFKMFQLRSSPVFLYTIEQCLVNGVHLLLTHFPFPLNPALLPVLALGQFRHRIGQSK